jgi:hypothetical protein
MKHEECEVSNVEANAEVECSFAETSPRAVWRWRALLVATLLVVAFASAVSNAMSAYASSPGNQVFFETATSWCHGAGPLGKITISGTNQYGRPATWTGFPGDGHSVTTTKWWWVGNITVSDSVHGTIQAWVPPDDDASYRWDHGIVYVTCAGTLQYADVLVGKSDHYDFLACAGKGNPTGHYTSYDHWTGYWYRGHEAALQAAYGWESHGRIVPTENVKKYSIPDCG